MTRQEYQKKYGRTFKGKVVRIYADMKKRVGGNTNRPHIYKGLELCSKDEFYEFSFNDLGYKKLFEKWEQSGFDDFYKPSIDRIDSAKGYILGNMRWLTEHDNKALPKGNVDLSKYELITEEGELPF